MEREIIEEKSAIELNMERLGLVDIRMLDSSIQVDLRYSSENNFTGRDIVWFIELLLSAKGCSVESFSCPRTSTEAISLLQFACL